MSSPKFKEFKLSEIELKNGYGTVDGPFGSNLPASAYTDSGVPVIRGVNLSLGNERFKDYNYVFVSENTADKLTRSSCQANDIVFTKKGTLGQTGLVPSSSQYKYFILSSNQMRIRLDTNLANPLYLYYFVSSPDSRQRILSDAMTTGVPKINLGYLRSFKVLLPAIETQKKIAAILSAYDDLIENNKKRIQILENIAEELYKEWFVRFRFPNWENTEFERGVPKGWEIEKISNLVDRKKFGRVYKEFELASEGSIPVIDQSQKDILGFHEGEAEHKASFESPMIIFGDHSCKMQMMFKNFSLAENVIPFKSKGNISLLYLFSLIKDQVETTEYKRHWGELTSKKVLLAPIRLQEKYASLVIDKMKLIESLKTANNYLVSCRDQLLPRLISGKLSVEDLDIQFPPSMQDQ